jgi:hypothetical protein
MDDKYEAVLADLENKKAEWQALAATALANADDAEAAIAALRSVIARSSGSSPGTPQPGPEVLAPDLDDSNYQSLPVRVLAFFSKNPHRVFTVQEIFEAVRPESLHPLHGLVSRFVKEEKIVRVGRARYRAIRNASKQPENSEGRAAKTH